MKGFFRKILITFLALFLLQQNTLANEDQEDEVDRRQIVQALGCGLLVASIVGIGVQRYENLVAENKKATEEERAKLVARFENQTLKENVNALLESEFSPENTPPRVFNEIHRILKSDQGLSAAELTALAEVMKRVIPKYSTVVETDGKEEERRELVLRINTIVPGPGYPVQAVRAIAILELISERAETTPEVRRAVYDALVTSLSIEYEDIFWVFHKPSVTDQTSKVLIGLLEKRMVGSEALELKVFLSERDERLGELRADGEEASQMTSLKEAVANQ